MQKALKYTIFKTKWGYFGLAYNKYGLLRTQLPGPEPEKVKSRLLKELRFYNKPLNGSIAQLKPDNLQAAQFDKSFFKTTQEQIIAYFEGTCVNFSGDIPIILDGFSSFCSSVLTACRDIRFGQTTSYRRLAQKVGRASAVRAVGGALAKNPLPLIIPCHRVVYSNGKIGGFSAPGGITLKKRMLELEKNRSNAQVFGQKVRKSEKK